MQITINIGINRFKNNYFKQLDTLKHFYMRLRIFQNLNYT